MIDEIYYFDYAEGCHEKVKACDYFRDSNRTLHAAKHSSDSCSQDRGQSGKISRAWEPVSINIGGKGGLRDHSGVQGRSPGRGSMGRSPPEAEAEALWLCFK